MNEISSLPQKAIELQKKQAAQGTAKAASE
jgi:hypothetical protein